MIFQKIRMYKKKIEKKEKKEYLPKEIKGEGGLEMP